MAHTLGEIAEAIGTELRGDPARAITGVATLSNARPDQLSFLGNPRWVRHLGGTRAAAVILRASDLDACPVNALTRSPDDSCRVKSNVVTGIPLRIDVPDSFAAKLGERIGPSGWATISIKEARSGKETRYVSSSCC